MTDHITYTVQFQESKYQHEQFTNNYELVNATVAPENTVGTCRLRITWFSTLLIALTCNELKGHIKHILP